ncbi:membrane progestin receptor beta-like [Styela clava]
MASHMKHEETKNCNSNEENFLGNIQSPIQGLRVAIGGLEIISCLIEKINRVRDYAIGNGSHGITKHKNSRNFSILDNALNVFTDLKTKIAEIVLPPYNENKVKINVENKQTVDDNVLFTSFETNKRLHEENNNVVHRNPKNARLWRSHSQGCIRTCNHDHHAHISSWKHAMKVHRSQVPEVIQEPYIEYGYLLPFMPWSYYLRGLYTPSYEFMNVWTHLIPSIYFFYLLFAFSQEINIIHAWPLFLVLTAGTLLCFFSASAHLFHSKSSLHHSCWFVADYFGISLFAFASLSTNFYSGAHLEYFKIFSSHYLKISTLIVTVGYTCLCLTQTGGKWVSLKLSRQLKVFVNGFGYAFGAIPLYLRMYDNFSTGKSEASLWWHGIALPSMFLAPAVYGLDFPQRFFPGKFDVFGHSHMWFHILTAFAAYCEVWGVYYDVTEGPWSVLQQQEEYPTLFEICVYYIIIVMYGYIVGKVIHSSVKDDHVHEEPLLQGKHLCSCGLPETARIHHRTHRISRIKSESNIYLQEISEEEGD